MNAQIVQFKRELNLSSGAKKHLEDKLLSKESIEKFDIGFCPANSSFEFDLLNGRLIVPIYDVYGDCVAYAGRRLDFYSTDVKNHYQNTTNNFDGLNKFLKWKNSKWLNTPYPKAKHLFNLNNAKKSIYEKGFCFVVEGYFDVIYMDSLGYTNVVALCGTSLTDAQCDLIFRYCQKIVLMLDGDEAGVVATNKSVIKAGKKNLYANIVELPDECDPDDLEKETLKLIFDSITNSEEELYIKL
jgi:DNA primase